MKIKTLVNKAKQDIKDEREVCAIKEIKVSLKRIADCKKTLKKLEQSHNTLLNTDIDDLEIDGYEY